MQMDETLNALTDQVAAFCQIVIAPRLFSRISAL